MAFAFLLAYLVVLYIRPAEWIPAFYGWQLADVTLIGAGVFLAFQIASSKGGMVRVPHTRMIGGLFASVLLSHLSNTYFAGMTGALENFGKIIVTYLLIVQTVTTPRKLQVTLGLLALLTGLLALQGIHQAQTGYGWAGQTAGPDGRIRWISIFNDPNDLALAFTLVVPVLLAFLVAPGFIGGKAFPALLLGLVVYGVYLTNSRGGALGLMAALLFFFIKRSRYVVPGGIIGGLLASLFFLFGPSRLGMLAAGPDESAYGRLDSWYYGFQLMKQRPVFGVGYNMFTNDYPLTAHNSFVLAAAELGAVGLCCWVGLFYASFKGLSLVQKHHPRFAPQAYGLQASLIGFLATAFFLSRTYNELPYLICALSAALYAVARRDTDLVEFRWTARDTRNVVLLSVGSLLLVQVAMKTWL